MNKSFSILGCLGLAACVASTESSTDNISDEQSAATITTSTSVFADPPANTSPKGTASLIFFYFGDSYLTTLGQETINLSKAFDNYDYKVLLAEETTIGFFDLNEQAQDDADVWKSPTESNFINQVKSLTEAGYIIDIYIFAHGGDGTSSSSTDGKFYTSDGSVTASDLTSQLAPSVTGYKKQSIRMVYQVNCYGSEMNAAWTDIGAQVAAGARDVNFYPNQFKGFIDSWQNQKTYSTSLSDADTSSSRTLVQTYIGYVLAPSQKNDSKTDDWEGCPITKTVLGSNSCAEDYFSSIWGDWFNRDTGKENMNYSSTKLVEGNGYTKITTTPTWGD